MVENVVLTRGQKHFICLWSAINFPQCFVLPGESHQCFT
jgi:hypothetical protein